ncbi:amino acid ABC transporter substrate-binding protein [Labrys miyagiensis]
MPINLRKKILTLLAASILGFVGAQAAMAQTALELNEPGKLTVCIVDANAPMSSVVNGKLVGYEVSFSEEVAKRLGLTPDFKFTVFEGIFAAVANHVCDMSAGSHSITLKRLEIINFSRPHFVGSYTILSKADSAVKTADDLAGKRLGVVAASIQETYANETYKSTTIVPFPELGGHADRAPVRPARCRLL